MINSNFLCAIPRTLERAISVCRVHTSAEAYRGRGMINRSLHLSFGSYDSAPWCSRIPRERGLDKWSGFKYTVKAFSAKNHLDITIKFAPDFPRSRKIGCWKRRALANAPACAMNAYTRLKSVLQSVPWLLLILNGGPFDASDRMNIVVCLIKKYWTAREPEEETGGNDLLFRMRALRILILSRHREFIKSYYNSSADRSYRFRSLLDAIRIPASRHQRDHGYSCARFFEVERRDGSQIEKKRRFQQNRRRPAL